MLTDEVKAALEWWREESKKKPHEWLLPPFVTIMDAYAELHPPDDDEPLTHEFVQGLLGEQKGMGYYECDKIPGSLYFYAHDFDEAGGYKTYAVLYADNRQVKVLKTRGQLRRLIAALED